MNPPPFRTVLSMELFAQAAENLQRLLAEANQGVPWGEPTPEEIDRLAAIDDEKKSEGRTMRPFRHNFKE